ncbi:MAG: hypothetical protein WBE94_25820 [Pseudolabrys sp.]|jgi:hypothetical protein|nr:hypothetical protein [Pseudolabrys sp.]
MSTDAAVDQVKNDLKRAFEMTRADLERVEILAAGLAAFSAPIPSYEPRFHHLRRPNLNARELSSGQKSRR